MRLSNTEVADCEFRVQHTNGDLIAYGTNEGKIYISSEKAVDAHSGAVLSLQFNSDCSALCSSGEDGVLKIWSRVGMLRSILHTQQTPIYSSCWSSDNSVLFTCGCLVTIKPLQPTAKSISWKAHDLPVLCVACCNLIITGGEDKTYKVWDSYGRLVFASPPLEHAVTCLSWAPDGENFAVGLFNTVMVCDKLGWTLCIASFESGSIYSLEWSAGGNMVTSCSLSGKRVQSYLCDRRYSSKNFDVDVINDKKVMIRADVEEEHEFKDSIWKTQTAHNALVFITQTQAHTFVLGTSLHTFELSLKSRVTCLCLSKSLFAIVDLGVGILVYSYAGKLQCTIKIQRPDTLNESLIALSDDVIAFRDTQNDRNVMVYDVSNSTNICTIKHLQSIIQISCDHVSHVRHLSIIDKNWDLFIVELPKAELLQLGSMVESALFSQDSLMLAAIMDGHLCFWLSPGIIFVDPDIINLTKIQQDVFKSGTLKWFSELLCCVRRGDGAEVIQIVKPFFTVLLLEFATLKKWETCVKICRTAKSNCLWACLAGMSMLYDINTAEVCYAAIGDVEKVEFICGLRRLKTKELRAAEMLIFQRKYKEAESLLLSSKNVFPAIKMWVDLYQWNKALDLAQKFTEFMNALIYLRQQYISRIQIDEKNPLFMKECDQEAALKVVNQK